MLFPLLTEYDPAASSEGTLDPLGLYAIADSLAVQMIPGVRERQSHPRFLTAIAVSLAICSKFDADMIAKDGVSEPWQVFEWYMVEGLVRRSKDPSQLEGLPGRDKVARVIKDEIPLSASSYLKTPSVFGFHGVYRLLSRTLGVELSGRLGEFGYELLTVWAKEQGLAGFCGTIGGTGKEWYGRMQKSVADGIEKGKVDRSSGWNGWDFFRQYLAHLEIGKDEARTIINALIDGSNGFRRPVINFLISEKGRAIVEAHELKSKGNPLWRMAERKFHTKLFNNCDSSLKDILTAIDKYETFSRILQDAFDDCLYEMSQEKVKVYPKALSTTVGVQKAFNNIAALFEETIEPLSHFGEAMRFQDTFKELANPFHVEEWVDCLLNHHIKIQHMKQPQPVGKAPWFERFDDGGYIIRPAYRRKKGGLHDIAYVHGYRTASLWSFAKDLRLIQNGAQTE